MSQTDARKAAVDAQDANARKGLRSRLIRGYVVTAIFLFGVLGYAAAVEIRGAVIAPGNVVVEGNIRRIQHQDGGSIAEISCAERPEGRCGRLAGTDRTRPRLAQNSAS